MPTHAALLRGVNVGGRKVAMADLREIVSGIGHTDVATYVNSGNVVFTSNVARAPADRLASELEAALAEQLGMSVGVVVLSRADLARTVADNPFPEETTPKNLHAVFRRAAFGAADEAAIAEAERRARDKGTTDERATIVGGVLYLHLPNGMGRSELAAQLGRKGTGDGTARNWATVTKLLAMLEA